MAKHCFLDEVYYKEGTRICNSLYIDSFGINALGEEIVMVAHVKDNNIIERNVEKKEIYTTRSSILKSVGMESLLIQENEIDKEKIKQHFLGENMYEGEAI